MTSDDFLPDLGRYFVENGNVLKKYVFMGVTLGKIGIRSDELFTVYTEQEWDGRTFAESLDIPGPVLAAFIEAEQGNVEDLDWESQPLFLTITPAVITSVTCHLGECTLLMKVA
jgi:hypothetical protein